MGRLGAAVVLAGDSEPSHEVADRLEHVWHRVTIGRCERADQAGHGVASSVAGGLGMSK